MSMQWQAPNRVSAPYQPEPGDAALLAALAHDGRADMSTLSAACDRSESTIRRRPSATP
jgi:hypothetical protein